MKKGFFADFKAFISKGNILDMAVGVIMGGAFGKIVTSLVQDIIMPAIGGLFGTASLSDMKHVISEAVVDPETLAVTTPEVAIRYGQFIQFIIDFLIVAICMFVVIRFFMTMRTKLENLKKEEEVVEEAAPTEPTVEEKTLATLNDIKELLEKNNK